ncbi:MAG: two pore domain potassium channel family protein [Cytophagales bacterium]|nr:two pore domain potassium channel family protein [Cytophagales bacterium]
MFFKITNMKTKSLVLISLLICVFNVYTAGAQKTPKRTLSFQQWIDEMVNCKDSVYVLDGADIIFDETKDNEFGKRAQNDQAEDIIIHADIVIKNCNFKTAQLTDEYIRLNHFTFRRNVMFWDNKAESPINFNNCTFNARLDFLWNDFSYLFIYDTYLKGSFIEGHNNFATIEFNNVVFEANHDSKTCYFVLSSKSLKRVEIYNSKFQLSDSLKELPIEPSMIPGIWFNVMTDNLTFNNNTFDLPVSFGGLTAHVDLAVKNCSFNNFIDVEAINFPERNINFDWKMLSGRLSILNQNDEGMLDIYQGKTDAEIADFYHLKELIAAYNKFFKIYRERGDIESANACFIEMKDLDTRRLKYNYEQSPTFESYLSYKVNVFLKFFCDYGTNPPKSLIISFYVILIFSVFYFFFQSEWDNISRSFLMRKSNKLLQYFRSEQKLEDFYSEQHKAELQSWLAFRDNIIQSKKEVPLFITLLLKPLYRISVLHHKVTSWLYHRTDILSGRWIDLKPARKWFVATTVSISIIFYLVYLVALRSFNAFFLSINTFSTLGFGDIPVKGISRYMAILEGFLGWFLLSIFSVSLISQILQN